MNSRDRLWHRGTLAAFVATGVVALAALAASPAAASVIPARTGSVSSSGTVSSTVSTTIASPLALPALPVLAPAVKAATSRVARLGSCSAAMMDL
ncbi:MAG: hypothetical protein ABI692_16110 [Terracoccus sp.]